MSLVVLIQRIVLANIDSLMAIQFDIDVVTNDLIKLPGGMYAYQFVMKILK